MGYRGPRRTESVKELVRRFWSWVVKTDSCWLWTGSKDQEGYGRFHYWKSSEKAHRMAYRLLKGKVKRELHHTCKNKACVNPKHLKPVTAKQHIHLNPDHPGFKNAHKTHCPKGHSYSKENTLIEKRGGATLRNCRECKRELARKWHREKRKKWIKRVVSGKRAWVPR